MSKKWMIAAVLALSGCAAADGSTGVADSGALSSIGTGQCFEGDAVNNFNVRDRRTLYVSTRQNYVFRLDADADCFPLGTTGVSVTPFNSRTPRVCVGGQAAVSASQVNDQPDRCIVRVSGPILDSSISGLRSRQN